MKIICITPVFPPIRAGMARAAFEIARALAERAEVEVFAPVSPPAMQGEIKRGFSLKELKPLGRIGYGSFHPTIGRVLHDADIVLLHYPFFGAMEPLALATLLPHRAKLVLWYHMDPVGTGLARAAFGMHCAVVSPLVLRRADGIVFASRDYVVSGPHAEIILEKPNREIPFGVFRHCEPAQTVISTESGSTGRVERSHGHEISPLAYSVEMTEQNRYGAQRIAMTEPVVFGFVGALDRQHAFKGVDVLLEAFRNVNSAARLVIVGDGDRRREYEAKAPPGVRFVGSVSDQQLVELYRLMDVLVLPSTDRSEAFGMVVAEAMACGTSAIVSNLPGLAGAIGPNDACGARVSPGDVGALTSAMQDVIQNRDAWRDRGRAAAAYAAEHYRWDRVALELVDFFETVRQM